MAEEPFRLIIMDSITANLRVDFTGRGTDYSPFDYLAWQPSSILKPPLCLHLHVSFSSESSNFIHYGVVVMTGESS